MQRGGGGWVEGDADRTRGVFYVDGKKDHRNNNSLRDWAEIATKRKIRKEGLGAPPGLARSLQHLKQDPYFLHLTGIVEDFQWESRIGPDNLFGGFVTPTFNLANTWHGGIGLPFIQWPVGGRLSGGVCWVAVPDEFSKLYIWIA